MIIRNRFQDRSFRRAGVIQILIYYLVRGLLAFCSFLPLSVLHSLAVFFGRLMYWLPTKAKDTTTKNLRHCFPEIPEPELQMLIKISLVNTACTALEMGKAWIRPIEETLSLVVEEQGYAGFRQDVEKEHGVILLAPHLGNWEIFGFFASEGLPSNFMYQPSRIAGVDRLLREVRARSGVHMAPTNRKGVAELLGALKRGEMVGVLPDQVPNDESGVFVPFFNQAAFTMTLVSKLVQRTGARVYCGYAKRLPNTEGFCAVFSPADQDIYNKDLNISVTALNRTVENAVKQSLTQYQWEYKRFRRQPDNSEFYRINE